MVIVLDSGSEVRVEDLVNYQGSLMKRWGGGGEGGILQWTCVLSPGAGGRGNTLAA